MKQFTIPRSGRFLGTALATTLMLSSCRGGPPAGMMGGPPAFPVEVQQLEASTVQEASEFVGALEASDRVALRPEVSGRIVEIFVAPGQQVTAGTPIAQLSADRTQAELSGAVADVEASRAAVTTATAQLRAAEAERDRNAADVTLRETELRRIRILVDEGAFAQQNLDEAVNARATAQAALRAAEEQVGAARAALAETQARFERARADQAVAAEGVRDQRVLAPIAGVVGNVPAKVGDFVTPSDAITSIIQNSTLDLNISVPIERAPELRVGMPVELLDAQGNAAVRGRISFISPEVTTQNQAVLARVTFANDGSLKDGQLVRTRVIWESSPGLLIPTAAVTRIAGQTFVYVAETGEEPGPDGEPMLVARQRPVTLGSIQGNGYQVISGVQPGEEVIVSGILNLQDGVPISRGQPVSQQ
ncbi:efflux RND transporter periplasmic adaptor subunit [Leptolyngbya sp. AN02str]|uniref:efflux RND transporter periplasmic adaptor subunit n=1 Tax=Leptolyngbya sp. AN02str TaxID=3423363 RepID=UPI003D3173E3